MRIIIINHVLGNGEVHKDVEFTINELLGVKSNKTNWRRTCASSFWHDIAHIASSV